MRHHGLAMLAAAACAIAHRLPPPQKARRNAIRALCALPIASAASALDDNLLPGELDFVLSPMQYAVKLRAQQQRECYEALECSDDRPYWQIECDRDDTECLANKRRAASKEWQNFSVDPTSSPVLLFAAGALVFQWGSAALRILRGLLRKSQGGAGEDESGDES